VPLVRWAGISAPKADKHQELQAAWQRLTQVGHDHIEQIREGSQFTIEAVEQARQTVDATAQLASDITCAMAAWDTLTSAPSHIGRCG
jgi:hypothetical protein